MPKKRAVKSESASNSTSGVIHNFNNLLSVIVSKAGLLRRKVQDHDFLNDLGLIQKAALEASQIVQRLKVKSQKGFGKKVWTNMNELLSEVIDLTEAQWQENIRVSFQLASIPKVYVWAASLKEVFLNVILNAIDAMSEKGGVLVIQTFTQGKKLKISISDTGTGMNPGTIRQLFKPFFTTKGEKGSGLGLSTSHEIIKKHKGTLEVQSTPGQGTTFIVSLPLPRKNNKPKEQMKMSFNVTTSIVKKRVMLVDDEVDYRKSTAELLSMEGYDVDQAADGAEALEKLKKKNYDVVLSDISMPKISGCDLAKKVKLNYKDTKVILISGFNEKLNQEKLQSLKVDGWLIKPCLFEDIAEVIKKTCH